VSDDKRVIEDYLPIKKISAEASREKSVRKGHISTLHIWWARRPLVACRAAVYGALVPASRFVPNGASDEKKRSLGRANAAKFIERLCRYPSDSKPEIAWDIERAVKEAQQHILEAHAQRLTQETGTKVTVDDIVEGRASRPKVLDMFAGGGAIPLEALRLGCETYAVDLNPVAHIIELCTLVYPQKFGSADPGVLGMTGPKNAEGETTWGGLAEEVRYWGNWVLQRVKAEIGDLYPLVPDPEFKGKKVAVQTDWLKKHATGEVPPGHLMPVGYLWTRTVTCKNPHCRATVPLVKQTWLCKKTGRYVALKIIAPKGKKQVTFEVVETRSEKTLGFDPEIGSTGGNATCPFCGTVADSDYVKAEGISSHISTQLMAVVCTRPGKQGKVYLASDDVSTPATDDRAIQDRIQQLCTRSGLTVPSESIVNDAKNANFCVLYGLTNFGLLFKPRQMLSLLSFAAAVRNSQAQMEKVAVDRAKAILTILAVIVDRLADFNSSLCTWNYTGGRGVLHTYARQALPMIWDFAETNPFNPDAASWVSGIEDVPSVFESSQPAMSGIVTRASAVHLAWPDSQFDAIVSDPPYYDNVPYANISDFFYVWLKRTIGHLYREHFAAEGTPKKTETVADATRHHGSKEEARRSYEEGMRQAFQEAHRVLKPGGEMVIVYAHKTTLGWSTLVDALRNAKFTVTEAWPLDTEKPGRLRSMESAALASSIFLVARKRDGTPTGNYEQEVRLELEQIVRERVGTLWEMGISGADLVIACVGAGLRAFTRFARVEYANGEEVPAERFLTEVETVVLETILARLSKEVGGNDRKRSLAGLDSPTRFYVLWRYTYKAADLDSGEAIIFANGTHVELEGAHGLSAGGRALVAKSKTKYHLLDYTARGDDAALGIPSGARESAPLIDVLHRLLWLMERHPSKVGQFLQDARPSTEQLRLVAQALTGPALKGGELGEVASGSELAALTKLTANWRSVVEDVDLTRVELEARRVGQSRIQFDKGGRG
jgi:putative DNA methylase